jgi:hypothetical protein
MAPTTFILTNSPFVLSQIALASFVPNTSQPHQDAKKPYKVEDSDYSIQPDENFNILISSSSETVVKVLATKFASFFLKHDQDNTLRVTAEQGNVYSLNNPSDLFKKIVFGEEAGESMQIWLENCKQHKVAPRFIVAYRTFIDAQLSRGQHIASHISGKVTAPISTAQGDPSGLADIEAQASRKTNSDVKGDMKTPGERIYAICYRKINISYRNGKIIPSLDQTNKWEPFAGARGEADAEETYAQADMLEEDDNEDCEIYTMRTKEGETLSFGFLPELESEEEMEE